MTATDTPATPDGLTARAPEDPLPLHHGIGLYIHIPFCATKCTYCDFNTFAGIEPLMPAVVDALETELTLWATRGDIPEFATVFFGGGTPSYLPATDIQRLIDTARTNYGIARDAELTLEANPDDISATKLASWQQAGINRLSIGVQSFNDTILRTLSRRHSSHDALDAVEDARQAGFRNISIDLMYGLPNQTLDDWNETLRIAADLAQAYDRRRTCPRQCSPPIEEDPLRNHRKSGCRSGQFSPPNDEVPLLQSAGFSSIEGQCSPTIDESPLKNHRKSGCRSCKCSPPIDEGPLLQSAGFSSIEGQCSPPIEEDPLRNHRKSDCRCGKWSPPTDEDPLRNHRKSSCRSGKCSPPIDEDPLRNHRKSSCRSGKCSPPTDKGPLLQSAGYSSIEGQCLPPIDESPLRNHRKSGCRSGKCSPPIVEGPP